MVPLVIHSTITGWGWAHALSTVDESGPRLRGVGRGSNLSSRVRGRPRATRPEPEIATLVCNHKSLTHNVQSRHVALAVTYLAARRTRPRRGARSPLRSDSRLGTHIVIKVYYKQTHDYKMCTSHCIIRTHSSHACGRAATTPCLDALRRHGHTSTAAALPTTLRSAGARSGAQPPHSHHAASGPPPQPHSSGGADSPAAPDMQPCRHAAPLARSPATRSWLAAGTQPPRSRGAATATALCQRSCRQPRPRSAARECAVCSACRCGDR